MGCLDPTKRPTCPSQHKVHTKSHFLRDSSYFGILWMGKWKWKPKIGWESRQMEDKADVFDLPRKPHLFPSQNSISYATTSMEDTARAFPTHSMRGIKIMAYILRRLQTNLTSAPASWFSSPASLRRTWNIPTIRTTLPTHIC